MYVSPDAKQPVNLDGSTVKSIQDRLESPNAATFNEAQKQVRRLSIFEALLILICVIFSIPNDSYQFCYVSMTTNFMMSCDHNHHSMMQC